MQVVIEIDDNLYTRLFDTGDEYVADMRRACVAIRKGTPLPEKHGDIIDRGFMVAKLLDEIMFGRVKTPMDYIDFIKNYKITVPATEGFTPYFCQNRLPEKEETDEDSD